MRRADFREESSVSGGADGALGFDSCKGVSGISGYLICGLLSSFRVLCWGPQFSETPGKLKSLDYTEKLQI